MNCSPGSEKQQQLLAEIQGFVSRTSGLQSDSAADGRTRVQQKIDGKFIQFEAVDLETVLFRTDVDGREFIQVNFCSGKKVLLTEKLIGFKPIAHRGVEVSKLPRVVTTPDIVSVFEAIQEALHAIDSSDSELTALKQVFEAVLCGGEAVGLDLSTERTWLMRIPQHITKITA